MVSEDHQLRSVPDAIPRRILGVPLMPYTVSDVLDRINRLVAARKPSYFITANLHYAMLTDEQPGLREVNDRAAFMVADGMPLVWASRLKKSPLPERVAGSDLIWRISEQAAKNGQRIFLLGGSPGVAETAALKLQESYPGLPIAGIACPPFRQLTDRETDALIAAIREARPDILFVAFGQPKGELWISENYEKLGVPVCVQVGASLDFVAGLVRRAPRWVQRIGFEWAFRLAQEPRRLLGRYVRNLLFLGRALLRRDRGRFRSSENRLEIASDR